MTMIHIEAPKLHLVIVIYLEKSGRATPRAVNFHRSGWAATRSQPPMAVYSENNNR